MSQNICPPIIQEHWMPEPDYRWAEVAQRHGEPLSEPIFPRIYVPVTKEEAPGYKAIIMAMREFNEQQKHP